MRLAKFVPLAQWQPVNNVWQKQQPMGVEPDIAQLEWQHCVVSCEAPDTEACQMVWQLGMCFC